MKKYKKKTEKQKRQMNRNKKIKKNFKEIDGVYYFKKSFVKKHT